MLLMVSIYIDISIYMVSLFIFLFMENKCSMNKRGKPGIFCLNSEEWDICNIGNMLLLVEWWKGKRLEIFCLSLLTGIIGSKVCK